MANRGQSGNEAPKLKPVETTDELLLNATKSKILDLIVKHCGVCPPDRVAHVWANALDAVATDLRMQLKARWDDKENYDPFA